MSETKPPQATPLVQTRKLRKVFRLRGAAAGDFVAVDDVSFEIQPASSLAIVGESGSGKTTVARILAGLETATAGTIEIDGQQRKRPLRRSLSSYARNVQMVSCRSRSAP